MSTNLKIRAAFRPAVPANGAGGGIGEMVQADHLVVVVDRLANGAIIAPITLAFADHAGLQLEWEEVTGTTVLAAAVKASVEAQDLDMSAYSAPMKARLDVAIAIAE